MRDYAAKQEAEGMDEMAEKFREQGAEVYKKYWMLVGIGHGHGQGVFE